MAGTFPVSYFIFVNNRKWWYSKKKWETKKKRINEEMCNSNKENLYDCKNKWQVSFVQKLKQPAKGKRTTRIIFSTLKARNTHVPI